MPELARDPINRCMGLACLGFSQIVAGDADSAIASLQQALVLTQQTGVLQHQGAVRVFLAEACLLKGNLDAAERYAVEAMDLVRRARYYLGLGRVQRVVGLIAAARGDTAGAAAREIYASLALPRHLARADEAVSGSGR